MMYCFVDLKYTDKPPPKSKVATQLFFVRLGKYRSAESAMFTNTEHI